MADGKLESWEREDLEIHRERLQISEIEHKVFMAPYMPIKNPMITISLKLTIRNNQLIDYHRGQSMNIPIRIHSFSEYIIQKIRARWTLHAKGIEQHKTIAVRLPPSRRVSSEFGLDFDEGIDIFEWNMTLEIFDTMDEVILYQIFPIYFYRNENGVFIKDDEHSNDLLKYDPLKEEQIIELSFRQLAFDTTFENK